MKLTVIAEGVETEQQQVFLRAEGCDKGQGVFVTAAQFQAQIFPQPGTEAKTSPRVKTISR